MPANYPTDADLTKFLRPWLKILDVGDIEAIDFSGAIAAAVAQWDLDTGYAPFLAVSDSRYFDPPGPEKGPVGIYLGINNVGGGTKLFAHTGLVSVTSVTTGLSPANTTGTVLTLNQDYWLSPRSAPQYGRPYSYIEFRFPQWGIPASIKLVGVFGYSLTVPQDAWNAVLRMAALHIMPLVEMIRFQGMQSFKEADVSESYGVKPFASITDQWTEFIDRTRMRYARKSIF